MAGLKLRAKDAEDLKVVSTMLQDAIVPICDLAYLPAEKRFVLIANRFRWEADGERSAGPTPDTAEGDLPYERTNCAVRFQGVDRVGYRNLDLTDRRQMLSLLALEQVGEGVLLHFSGGSCIRLVTASLDCVAEDLGEPWPTASKPQHDAEGGVAQAAGC